MNMKTSTMKITIPQPMAMALLPIQTNTMPSISTAGNSKTARIASEISISISKSVMNSEMCGISILTQYMNSLAPKRSIKSSIIRRLNVLMFL